MKRLITLALTWACLQANSQIKEADNLYLLDLFQTQRYQEASEYLKTVYKEPITDKNILSRFGYSLKMAGKYSEAGKYYSRILDQNPADLPTLFNMAGLNQSKGNYSKASEYYKLILAIDSTNFSVYKQLSNLIESTEGLLLATGYIVKANELNPHDGDIAYSLSRILRENKQLSLAEKVLDTAIAADSSNLILLRGKAELAYSANRWPAVIQICDRLIKEGETSSNIQKMLGQAHYAVKNYDRAIDILTGLEASGMQNESTMYYAALSYKAKKDHAKAIEYFNKTILEAVSPNTGEYYAQIGDINEKNNQTRAALAAYQKSLTFDLKPITLYSIATFYDQKLKNKTSALRYYKRYLSSNPGPDHASYTDYSKHRIGELSK
jgi:tetratricopeptide (TPR) repeat protein